MKIHFLFVVSIWVVSSSSSFSVPLDVKSDPPVSDPILPRENSPFFVNSSSSIAQPPVGFVKVVHRQDLNKKMLIALVVASALLGGLLLLFACFLVRRMKKSNSEHELGSDLESSKTISFGPILDKFSSLKSGSISTIEYQLLETATNNFDQGNLIGENGIGLMYKALLSNDIHASVKKLYARGSESEREFENEVQSLSKIQHPNIVSLLGYCSHREERFVVYEFTENRSLEFNLHESDKSVLTWHVRMKIALDVARGLEYLHEHCNPPMIHRDLKSSNILLDSKFNAKLSDFGLAITGGSQSKNHHKFSETLGYLAPEYLLNGKFSEKSDVYAFGVVLLELLMGRRPVERVADIQCQSLVTWAMPQLTDRLKLPNIIDPTIRNTMDLKHLYQVAAIAVLCVQPEPSYRPLITDVLHSFIPLVPAELGGSLRMTDVDV